MHILVDLDGVCADFYGSFIKLYNQEYGANLKREQVTTWALDSQVFTKVKGKELYKYFSIPGFWRELAPLPGAKESLKYLHDKGHELTVVTAIPHVGPTACHEKINWVEEHLPFIGYDRFVGTACKYVVAGDMIIDDAEHNIKAFPKLTCIMDAPYNQGVEADYRVKSWESAVKVVEGISK